jgi:hypothetical protein
MAIRNKYNFLRWDDQVAPQFPEMPRPYRRDRGACPYLPVAYPTEILSFYINADVPFTDIFFGIGAWNEMGFTLINASTGAVAHTFVADTTLVQHFLNPPTNSQYNILATFAFPSVPNGLYYFRIYGGTGQLKSNLVIVRNDLATLQRETAYVRFRHDRFFYNIPYATVSNFYQQFRIHLSVLERQLDSDVEQYREVTTGKNRTSENYLSRYYRLESYFFDDDAHEAMGIALEHSFLEINGKKYTKKAVYKEGPSQLSGYSKGEAEVWDEEFASVNRC